jgi:hypothetical protein
VSDRQPLPAIRSTDVVLPTGEVVDLDAALEDRWQRALLSWGTGDPAPLLELGASLSEARALIYRIKERCDERVRDTLQRRGERSMVAGQWSAEEKTATASYIDPPGLRAELISAGMDADAADQFFELKVRDARKLQTLASRNDDYAQALAGHTKRGNPTVSYKRAGP